MQRSPSLFATTYKLDPPLFVRGCSWYYMRLFSTTIKGTISRLIQKAPPRLGKREGISFLQAVGLLPAMVVERQLDLNIACALEAAPIQKLFYFSAAHVADEFIIAWVR